MPHPSLILIFALVEIALLLRLSSYLSNSVFRAYGYRLFLIFSLPGVLVHEFSHLVACWMTRTKVIRFAPFSPQRRGETVLLGYVVHEQPRNSLSATAIGVAPVVGGVLALWLFAALLARESLAVMAAGGCFFGYCGFVTQLLASLVSLDWFAWIFVYLSLSVSAHLGPSPEDMRGSWRGLAALTVVLVLWLLATRAGWVAEAPLVSVTTALASLLTLPLAFNMVAAVIAFIYRRCSRV